MAKINSDLIRKLREETGAPVIQVKKVLDDFEGDEKKALEILRKAGFEKAAKRAERETTQGVVASYIHHSGKIGVMVELLCETDFVARNEMFTQLGKDIAMQVASLSPKNTEDLLAGDFVKDSSKSIEDLVKELIAKTGENIKVGKFVRMELGNN